MQRPNLMVDSATMTSPPAAVLDALYSLLDAEQNSVFRFMGEGSPYLSRATADVRRPLAGMVDANARHVSALGTLVTELGGYPPPRPVRMEEQYLAFLSLKFLLPKLVDEKALIIQRYDNALRAIPDAPPRVTQLLKSIQAEHRGHLEVLKKSAEEVIAASR